MNATGKFLVVLAVCIVALGAWAVYDGIASAAFENLPADAAGAYRTRAWIDPFFDLLPVATISAIVIAFSLAITAYDFGGEGTMFSRARGPLLVILFLGMLNTFWILFLQPYVDQRIDDIQYRGQFIRQLTLDIERDLSIPDRREVARDSVMLYRAILGDDAEDDETLRGFEEQLGLDGTAAYGTAGESSPTADDAGGESSDPEETSALSPRERSVRDLIDDAKTAYNEGDFFLAHKYASQAIELDQEEAFVSESRPLQSQAWEAIRARSREIVDKDDRDFFAAKMNAFEALQQGVRGAGSPQSLFEAYYAFEELYEINPDDNDVIRYRAETAAALERVSFFVEDAVLWADRAATYDLFFLNRDEGDLLEFVWVTRIVSTHEGSWLYDIEVLRLSGLDSDTPEVVHYSADYGKFLVDPPDTSSGPAMDRAERTDRIMVRAIRRDGLPDLADGGLNPENIVPPVYYAGEPGSVVDEMIVLSIPFPDLMRLAGGPERAVRLPFPTLLGTRASLMAIGSDASLVWRELAARSVRIFGFFIAAYWAIALSWKYRSNYLGRAPILVYFVLPVIPIAVYQIVLLTRRVLLMALDGLMAGLDFDLSILIVVIAISILALLGVFVALGRQPIDT